MEHESRFEFLLRVIITFSNNTARRRGAIHVRDNVQSIECTNDPLLNFATSIATNPLQCFFGIVNNETNGLDYKLLWFEGNVAREGGSVLQRRRRRSGWSGLGRTTFQRVVGLVPRLQRQSA